MPAEHLFDEKGNLKAKAAKELGDKAIELDMLNQYWQLGGRRIGAMQALARSLDDAGRVDDAIAVRRSIVRAAPLLAAEHTELGNLLVRAQLFDEALREYRAVLALGPHDRATAHYHVAATLFALEDLEPARLEVLRALEIAPRFKPALALLLEMN